MRCRRLTRFLPLLVISGTGVFMVAAGWLKWADVLVDYGRELYVPWRILEGDLLYHDLPHLYGPLAHHVNAALFLVFGTGLRTLVIANLVLVALSTLIIYLLFRDWHGRAAGTVCATLFLAGFALPNHQIFTGNFNFVCPYSHEAAYGVHAALLSFYALTRFQRNRKAVWGLLCGFFLGMVFLTKAEVFIAAGFSLASCVVLEATASGRQRAGGLGLPSLTAAGFLVPVLTFFACFAWRTSAAKGASMLGRAYTSLLLSPIVGSPLYKSMSGLNQPARNLFFMALGTCAVLVLAAGIVWSSRLYAAVRSRLGRSCLAGAVLVFALLLAWFLTRIFLENRTERFFTPLMIVNTLWMARGVMRARRGEGDFSGLLPQAGFSLFALLLLGKLFLKVSIRVYGFFLAMPAAMVLAALLVDRLPARAARRGGSYRFARMAALSLAASYILACAANSTGVNARRGFPVGQGTDRFYTTDADLDNRGPVIAEALGEIEATMPREATFVVVPEGVILNYLSRRRNPARYFEFTPTYVKAIGEGNILREWGVHPPDYFVVTGRATFEHGPGIFGVMYAWDLKDWIVKRYTPGKLIGSPPLTDPLRRKAFGLLIAPRDDLSGSTAPQADGGSP